MTKAELVAKIAKETGANPKEVLPVIECLMNTIKKTLSDGENVYLRGFGSFYVKHKAKKVGRNINRNTSIIIPAHNIPAFKPSKAFQLKNEEQ